MAAFGASLREEVDLGGLQNRILAVVEETMQPEFVSLWLRPVIEPVQETQPPPQNRISSKEVIFS